MERKKNIFTEFPGQEKLREWFKKESETDVPDINGHIHTPHSFSAFSSIEQAFRIAKTEGLSVLGINDFFTTCGYEEFTAQALKFNVFPLYNIEFIVLQNHLQKKGILVNDPNNPGRTYFSGKGLRYPVKMSVDTLKKVKELQQESNRQTFRMVDKVNDLFAKNHIDLRFDAVKLQKKLAKYLFRERHIAQAIRLAVFEIEKTDEGRKALFQMIFSGKELGSTLDNTADLENEIRSNLLKSGGAAFVPEDPKAFISMEEVMDIILDAGGIPCYPVLLDNQQGGFTSYEANKEKLFQELINNNVYSVELIPGRNDFKILKDFVSFFHKNGFIITFGTEHNTPKLDPLKITCRGGIPPDDELRKINYEGTAVIAAHQYLSARDKEGYLKGRTAKIDEKEEFVDLGKAVIAWFHKKFLNHNK